MHLGDPVAQRVHDQPQHLGPVDVQRVARAGGVDVARRVARAPGGSRPRWRGRGRQSVGPPRPALARVVVDDVEDHLEARRVQRLDHRLELGDLRARPRARRAVRPVRREEAERHVAPVVLQAHVEQALLGEELVHRQQLDRRYAEPGQVLDDRRAGHPGVRAAQLLRTPRDAAVLMPCTCVS